jgi:hypothetical protein
MVPEREKERGDVRKRERERGKVSGRETGCLKRERRCRYPAIRDIQLQNIQPIDIPLQNISVSRNIPVPNIQPVDTPVQNTQPRDIPV